MTVKEIESALSDLPLEELRAVCDRLEDLIEDQMELSDEYRAKVKRAKQEVATGFIHGCAGPPASR